MAEPSMHRVSRRTLIKGAAGAAGLAAAKPALSAKAAPTLLRLPSKQASGEITLWYFAFAPHENGYKAVIEKYNQNVNANVKFNLQSFPGADYDTKLRAALAAGQAPDVFNRHGPSIGEFVSAGFLLPLSQNVVTLDEVKTEFLLENYLQTGSYGDVYAIGVPDPPGDAGLIINVDLAKEAGLEVPTAFESFDQLSEYAEKLTKRQGDTVVQAGLAFNEGNDPVYVNSYVVEQGGTFWDNATQKFGFDTAIAEPTMQWFADIYLTKKWDSLDLPGDFDGLSQGVKAMSWMWPEYANYAKTVFPDLNLAFIGKPPYVAGNVPIFNHTDTWNAMVYSGTKNREAAEDFLRYLKTPEAQLTFAQYNPGVVILKKTLFEDPFYQTGPGAFLAPVIASIKAGQERYFGPWGNLDTLQGNIWWPTMTEILQGKTAVKDGLTSITQASDAELGKYLEKYPNAPKTTVYWTAADLPEGLSWS